MPERLSSSVKVRYLDREEILTQLRAAARKLKRQRNVQKVILFGSIGRGDCVPGSDADLCILLKEDHRRIIDRIPDLLDFFSDVNVPVDIFPYTVEEYEEMQRSGNPMVREIVRTGIEL